MTTAVAIFIRSFIARRATSGESWCHVLPTRPHSSDLLSSSGRFNTTLLLLRCWILLLLRFVHNYSFPSLSGQCKLKTKLSPDLKSQIYSDVYWNKLRHLNGIGRFYRSVSEALTDDRSDWPCLNNSLVRVQLFFYDPISYRVVGLVIREINGALGEKFNGLHHFSID